MLMLAIIFALTGAALGLRFKALVLAPASCFALASPVLTNFAYCYSLPVLALAMITTLMALQTGYLLGLRLGVEVVDNFRDHVALITAGNCSRSWLRRLPGVANAHHRHRERGQV